MPHAICSNAGCKFVITFGPKTLPPPKLCVKCGSPMHHACPHCQKEIAGKPAESGEKCGECGKNFW